MCGRYVLNTYSFTIADHLGIDRGFEDVGPSTNIAPTEKIAVVSNRNGRLQMNAGTFGFQTSWQKGPPFLINLKIEGVQEKAFARNALRHQRCVLPATGFMEWRSENAKKIPYLFTSSNEDCLGLAALFFKGPEVEYQCVILTTAANSLVNEVHHRMPVIVPPTDWKLWLTNDSVEELIERFSAPAHSTCLKKSALNTEFNKATYKGPLSI